MYHRDIEHFRKLESQYTRDCNDRMRGFTATYVKFFNNMIVASHMPLKT